MKEACGTGIRIIAVSFRALVGICALAVSASPKIAKEESKMLRGRADMNAAFQRRHTTGRSLHEPGQQHTLQRHRSYGAWKQFQETFPRCLRNPFRMAFDPDTSVTRFNVNEVGQNAWEGIPEDEKGKGKFRRKAQPGSWIEDLTPEQARVVEEITAPLLKEFYPEGR
jgi:hypothetical protein